MSLARALVTLWLVAFSLSARAVPLPFTPSDAGFTTVMGDCPVLLDAHGIAVGSGRLRFERAASQAWETGAEVSVHHRVGERVATTRAPTRLDYRELWPGIDMTITVTARGHKRDLIVHPGADPALFALVADGLGLALTEGGGLEVVGDGCSFREGAPVAWQEGGEGRTHVPIRWALSTPGRATFELGAFDPRRPLFIDPDIPGGGLFGPTLHEDAAYDVVIAPDGATYVVGGAHPDPAARGTLTRDAFVLALAPDLSLRWLTWFGGTKDNLLPPTCEAYATPNDPNSGCITWRSHPSGLGGNDDAIAATLMEDRLVVVGHTYSTDLPTLQPFIASPPLGPAPTTKGRRDGFVLVLDQASGAPVMASYLGGDSDDLVSNVVTELGGIVTVLGGSSSPAWGLPLPDPAPLPYQDLYAYAFSIERKDNPERWVPRPLHKDSPLYAVQPTGRAIFNAILQTYDDTWLLGDHRGHPIRHLASQDLTDYLAASGGAAIVQAFYNGSTAQGDTRSIIVGNTVGEVGGFDGLPCLATEPTACNGRPCGMTDTFVAFLTGQSCDNVAYIGGSLGDVLFGAARMRYAAGHDFLVLAGRTASADLATRAAMQPKAGQVAGNGVDAFYAVLDVETEALRVLSYLGGAPTTESLELLGSDDVATAVALGPTREATLVGMTRTLAANFTRKMGGATAMHQPESGQALVGRFPVEVAGLSLTVTPKVTVTTHGDDTTLELKLRHEGTVDARDVSVLVQLDPGLLVTGAPGCASTAANTWLCKPPQGLMRLGAQHTFSLTVRAPAVDGRYNVQATARASTHDPDLADNRDTAVIQVGGIDFAAVIEADEGTPHDGVVGMDEEAGLVFRAPNYGAESARARITITGSDALTVRLGAGANTCVVTRCGERDCLPVTCDLPAQNRESPFDDVFDRSIGFKLAEPPVNLGEVRHALSSKVTVLDGKTDANPTNDVKSGVLTFRNPDVVAVDATATPKLVAWGGDLVLNLTARDDGPAFEEGGLFVHVRYPPLTPHSVPANCDTETPELIACVIPRPPGALARGQVYSIPLSFSAPPREDGEAAREVSLPVSWRGTSGDPDPVPTNNSTVARVWLGAADVRVHPPEPVPTLRTFKVVETTTGIENHAGEVARDVVVSQTFSNTPPVEVVLARMSGVDCPIARSDAATTVTCTIAELAAGQRVNMLVDVRALDRGEVGHSIVLTTPVTNASAALFPSIRKFVAKGVDLATLLTAPSLNMFRGEQETLTIAVVNAGPGATGSKPATLLVDMPFPATGVATTAQGVSCSASQVAAPVTPTTRLTCALQFDGTAGERLELPIQFTPQRKGNFKITARVQSALEEQPADNDKALDVVIQGAELDATVTAPAKAEVGEAFDLIVRVENKGPAKSQAAAVGLTLPEERLEVAGALPTGCVGFGAAVSCPIELAPGHDVTLTIPLRGKKPGAASVTTEVEQADPAEGKRAGTNTVDILGPDIEVTHIESRPSAWLTPPQSGEVDFRVRNTSTTTAASGVLVAMTVASQTGRDGCVKPHDPVSSSLVSGVCAAGAVAGQLRCDLAAGAEAIVRFSPTANCPGESVLQVVANPGLPERDTANNKARATVSSREPKVGVTVVPDPVSALFSQTIEGPYDEAFDGYVVVRDLSGYGVGAGPDPGDKIRVELSVSSPFVLESLSAQAGTCQLGGGQTPPHCLLDSIAPNGSVPILFSVRSNHGPARRQLGAVVSGVALETTSATGELFARGPDLAVSVVSAPTGPKVDERGEWVVRVDNVGSGPAEHPALSVTEPRGLFTAVTVDGVTGCQALADGRLCSLAGPLAAGQSVSVTFGARFLKPGDVAIPVRATSRYEPDEVGTNNTLSLTTRVVGADLASELALIPDTVGVGDTLTLQLSANNRGSADAPASSMTLKVGASLELIALAPGCNQTQGLVVCTVAPLPATQVATFSFQARALRAGSFTLISEIKLAGDADPANDRASAVLTVTSLDSDGDGVDDRVEDLAKGGDGNGDGTPDRLQPHVTSLLIDKHGVMVAEALSGTTLELIPIANPPAIPAGQRAPVAPSGTFNFKVRGLTPGALATVRFTLPPGVPAQSWWKYRAGQWSEFTWDAATQTGAVVRSARVLEVTLADNGRGDDDPTPGVIADPGAPLLKEVVVDDPGDGADSSPGDGVCQVAGGGCTLRAALEEAMASQTPRYLSFAFAEPTTLAPSSPLPTLTTPVILDGSAVPGPDAFEPGLTLSGANLAAGPLLRVEAAGTALVGLRVVEVAGDAVRVTVPGVRVANAWLGRPLFGGGGPLDHAALRAIGADELTVSGVWVGRSSAAGTFGLDVQGADVWIADVRVNIHPRDGLRPNADVPVGVRLSDSPRALLERLVVHGADRGVVFLGDASGSVLRESLFGLGTNGRCNAFTRDDPGPADEGRGPCLDRNRQGLVLDGAHGLTVGGLDVGDGNTFGDHIDAIVVTGQSHDNAFYNNLVGLAADGTCQPAPKLGVGTLYDGLCRLYNVRGLAIEDGHDNVVGATGAGNVFGVGTLEVTGSASVDNTIRSNFIGLFGDLETPVRPGFTAMVQAPVHIGGGASGTRLEDNTMSGIEVLGEGTDDTVIIDNRVGLLPGGLALPGPGAEFDTYWRVWPSGVTVRDGPDNVTLSGNTVASTVGPCVKVSALERVVSGVVISGNHLGLGADGRAVTACEGGGLEVDKANGVVFSENLVGHCGSVASETFKVACVRVYRSARGSIVRDNVFGSLRDGRSGPWGPLAPLANPAVILEDAPATLIEGNTIIGAPPYGIYDRTSFFNVSPAPTDGARMIGNRIGLDPDGVRRGAPSGHGILAVGAHAKLGGVLAGEGNHIVGAGGAGIRVGNVVGVEVRGNVLEDNAGLGVSLGGEIPIGNDNLDSDGGPNGSQNHPRVTGFLADPPRAVVSLGSIPNRTFTIDVYGVMRPDPSGHGEADVWLGEATVVADPQGNASTTVALERAPLDGERLTAIATGPDGSSEFGPAMRPDALGVADLWASLYVESAAAGAWGYAQPFIENLGPDVAPDAVVELTWPDGVELGAAQYVTQGSCAPSGNGLRCEVGDLGPGEVWEANYLVRAATAGRYPVAMTASSRATDPVANNDTANVDFDVGAVGYFLQLTSWVPYRSYATNEPATLTATVAKWPIVNRPIEGIELVITAPGGARVVSGSHGCVAAGASFVCQLGTMANNVSTITADIALAFAEPGAHVVTLEARTAAPNFQGRQLTSLPTLTVFEPPPSLGFSLEGPAEPLLPGALGVWTATVENLGATSLSGVLLEVDLPTGLVFRGADIACGVVGSTLVCDPGQLAPGARTVSLNFEIPDVGGVVSACVGRVEAGALQGEQCDTAGFQVVSVERALSAVYGALEARIGESVPVRFEVESATGMPAGQVRVEVRADGPVEVHAPGCLEDGAAFLCAHPALLAGGSAEVGLEVRSASGGVIEVVGALVGAPGEAVTRISVSALEDCGAFGVQSIWGGEGVVVDGWSEAATPGFWVADFASATLTSPPLVLPEAGALRVGWRARQSEPGGSARLEWSRDGVVFEVLTALGPGLGWDAMRVFEVPLERLPTPGSEVWLRWSGEELPEQALTVGGLGVVACVPTGVAVFGVTATPSAGIADRGETFETRFAVELGSLGEGALILEVSPREALVGFEAASGSCVVGSSGGVCRLAESAEVLVSGRLEGDGEVQVLGRLVSPRVAEDVGAVVARSIWRVGAPAGEGAVLRWSPTSLALEGSAVGVVALEVTGDDGFFPGGEVRVEVPAGLVVEVDDPRCEVVDAVRCELAAAVPGEVLAIPMELRAAVPGGLFEVEARWTSAGRSAASGLAVVVGGGGLSLAFGEAAPAALEATLVELTVSSSGDGGEVTILGGEGVALLTVTGEGAVCSTQGAVAVCELAPFSGARELAVQVLVAEAGARSLFGAVTRGPAGANPTATLAWSASRDCAAHPCEGSVCEATSCDAVRGCVPVSLEGQACAPDEGCAGVCLDGGCVAVGPASCDDGDPCTNDSCVVGQGCVSTFIPSPQCDCSVAPDTRRCEAGAFVVVDGCGEEVSRTSCDDGDACTDDVCDATLGCRNTARDVPGCAGCVPVCGGALCGVDSRCGVSCGSCAEGGVCLDGSCVDDPCLTMPVTGCCDPGGDPRAASCSGGVLMLDGCGEAGCGWDEASGRWRCGGVDTPPAGDGGFCPWGPECETATHCEDDDPCTSEVCVEGRCEVTQLADCGTEPGPEEVEPGPEAVEAQPEEVEPQPEEVEAQPEDVEPGPEEVEAQPEDVEPGPEEVEAQPEVSEAEGGEELGGEANSAQGCGCQGGASGPFPAFGAFGALIVWLLRRRARASVTNLTCRPRRVSPWRP